MLPASSTLSIGICSLLLTTCAIYKCHQKEASRARSRKMGKVDGLTDHFRAGINLVKKIVVHYFTTNLFSSIPISKKSSFLLSLVLVYRNRKREEFALLCSISHCAIETNDRGSNRQFRQIDSNAATGRRRRRSRRNSKVKDFFAIFSFRAPHSFFP